MLTIRHLMSQRPLTLLGHTALAGGMIAFLAILIPHHAAAQEQQINMNLLLEPEQGQDYSYRRDHEDKTINLMLYGIKDTSATDNSVIPKDKKALNAFFKQHWENIRRDYLGNNENGMRVMAGDESFTSRSLNQNIRDSETAKMVGVTVPVGKFTLGGGYTWGEKNPAMMLETTEGFFFGASYDTGERMSYQVSYLTSGQEFMGLEAGGTDIQYSSILIGTSFRVNDRMGLTATAQYRTDDDPLTTGDSQAVFTVGTKWKF